jgi:UDP-N-acetylglucosamine 4,6-dehydratase
MDVLRIIGRDTPLFAEDLVVLEAGIAARVRESTFLVIGGAGSIGQAVTREIFKRHPRKLHVVDISENNMVELVRDIRSSLGYIEGDFRTFAVDCGSIEFEVLFEREGPYDYVLNLAALKHVRSEKDPYTLMRMVDVNIFDTDRTAAQAARSGVSKYFCVSTDKAANPVNMMGASKRIMEMFLMRRSEEIEVSTARFANVAFSDGSLLHGFNQRLLKRQPLSAPRDVKRYFLTPQESGELCLLSCLLGNNRDIFFPKLAESLHLVTFSEIAVRYLEQLGYEPVACDSEEEAREAASAMKGSRRYPCYFFDSDTTGEKDFEEFHTESEVLDMERFRSIGVVRNSTRYDDRRLDEFVARITEMKASRNWHRADLVHLFIGMIENFDHRETGRFLDDRM